MDSTIPQTHEAATSNNPVVDSVHGTKPNFADRVRGTLSKSADGQGNMHKHEHGAMEPVGVAGQHQKLSFMQRLRTSEFVQDVLRTLEFLAAVISFILFSIRLAKIVRLSRRASHSNGAVEGILTAAVSY